MQESQGIRPDDPYKSIRKLPDGSFEGSRFAIECVRCGGKMAHGKLFARIPASTTCSDGWHCQECHAAE